MGRTARITGIAGQDGSSLSGGLLAKGGRVVQIEDPSTACNALCWTPDANFRGPVEMLAHAHLDQLRS